MIVLLLSCTGEHQHHHAQAYINTSRYFKKEIPTYQDGSVAIFYEGIKDKQTQLGLGDIENGFDSLQIRLWYDFSIIAERRLVIIVCTNNNWAAAVYDMQVRWNDGTEKIISKQVKRVTPKSGRTAFSQKLLDLKIVTLPHQDDLKGYGGGTDGSTYNVEVATKDRYRFYGYWEPQEYADRFWQAKNMSDILKLIETELETL